GAASGRSVHRAVHVLDREPAAAARDARWSLKLPHADRPASRGAVEGSGTARDFDTTAACAESERPITTGSVHAAAPGITVERAVQSRETQSAPAGVGLHIAGEVNHANAATAGPDAGIELRGHAEGVLGFVLVTTAHRPRPLGFAVGPNRHS